MNSLKAVKDNVFKIRKHPDVFIPWLSQFSSVAQSCPILFNPMNRSMPGLPVHHQLPESPKPMSIESVMPSNHLILCCPFLPCLLFLFLPQPFVKPSQFSSATQSYQTLGNPMAYGTPGLPVHHQLQEFTQIHVH